MSFYKQRFGVSQHPNFLGIHYPTQFNKGEDAANIALVCEQLDENVTTLREWMNPQTGYLYTCEPEVRAVRFVNVIIQTLAMLNMLSRGRNVHGCISPDLILVANEGKTLKLLDSFLIQPTLGQQPGRFYGGNITYWSKSQGKLFDKLYEKYEIKGNQGTYGKIKIYDTNKPANDDENFKYTKVIETGNISQHCDVYSVCLIWVEIMLGERFWIRGDHPKMAEKLAEIEHLIRTSDKFSMYKHYRLF